MDVVFDNAAALRESKTLHAVNGQPPTDYLGSSRFRDGAKSVAAEADTGKGQTLLDIVVLAEAQFDDANVLEDWSLCCSR